MAKRNTINRPATGLLDLFLSKVNGQTPDEIRQDVQPTVDIEPFTRVGLMRLETDGDDGNPPTNLNIDVPADELWLIHMLSLKLRPSTTMATLESAIWMLQVQGMFVDSTGAEGDCTIGFAQMINPTAGNLITAGDIVWSPPRPFILEGGMAVQGQYRLDNTTNNYWANLDCLYSKISR